MTLPELLTELRQKKVELWLEGDRLRYGAEPGALTPALLAELAAHKAEVLAFLRTAQQAGQSDRPPLRRTDRRGPLPLSFAQQRLWVLDQIDPGTATYNIPFKVRLTGPLDIAALERALSVVVARQEALRTTFAMGSNGEPEQRIGPPATVELPVLDLRDRPADVGRCSAEEESRPFDLARGPLVRFLLLRVGETEHILLVTLHHTVFDGWSAAVMGREISRLYREAVTGEPARLPELPVQYADFARWQREWLQGEALAKRLDYWKQQLAGAPLVLEVPLDQPRPARQSFRGEAYSWVLPPELAQQLNQLARQEGVTLFVVLLAALDVLLYRYTGQADLLVATASAGRDDLETEHLVGFFINTLVLRANLTADPSFRALLRQTQETALGAFAHQDVPFERLVEELQPTRDLSRSPLCQVLFVLQSAPLPLLDLPGITAELLPPQTAPAKYELGLEVTETTRGLECDLTYAADLFGRERIERLAGHYRTLLEAVVRHPDTKVSELPLLTAAEVAQLDEWNETLLPCTPGQTMVTLFEAQVARTPDAVALGCGEDRLTFAELNGRANQLARHLRSLGIGPERLVGICLDRTPTLVVALLAVLKAGAAYVPVDPAYPKQRKQLILTDAQTRVVLTRSQEMGALPIDNRTVIDLELLNVTAEDPANLTPTAGPDNLAYVIFTSGSTGRPKGVAIEHRGVVAMIEWARSVFPPGEIQRVLFATSVCFDVSIFELFATLCNGGSVELVENVLQATPQTAVTLVSTVPSVMAELLRTESLPRRAGTICLAGEFAPQSLVDALYALPQVQKVYDLYGPTEDTTYSTFALRRPGGRPTIGRPIANTQVYLLDAHRQRVPVGVPGEIYLGGAGLARGYLGQPQLTAERFLPHPFDKTPGARLYRTGDLAQFTADGQLEYLGRLDRQVKIRGFRIELGEIQSLLQTAPGVREAAVVVREDVAGDKRLVAYVVGEHDSAPASQWRELLRQHLPEYMVPTAFVRLPALPLNPNGKLDVAALPAPDEREPLGPGASFVPPRDETEQLLAQVWEGVLRRHPVGSTDNFFALGGHSLLATQVMARVRDAVGFQVPLRSLFEHPTVGELAAHIQALRWARASHPPTPLGADGSEQGEI